MVRNQGNHRPYTFLQAAFHRASIRIVDGEKTAISALDIDQKSLITLKESDLLQLTAGRQMG